MKIEVEHLTNLPSTAEEVIEFLKRKELKFVVVEGQMGAGKTTLINEILRQMGVDVLNGSPTFAILNEYFSVNYGIIYHFDFYRIEDEIEALDIGVEEIFEEDAYVFIEWPERIENLLPNHYVKLSIALNDTKRIIELEVV